MTISSVTHLDEQHSEPLESTRQDHGDLPAGMLASPSRTRL